MGLDNGVRVWEVCGLDVGSCWEGGTSTKVTAIWVPTFAMALVFVRKASRVLLSQLLQHHTSTAWHEVHGYPV